MKHFQRASLLAVFTFCFSVSAQERVIFQTPIKSSDLDATALAVWVDGREVRDELPVKGPQELIWTQDSRVEWKGLTFGDSKTPGDRHARLGFKSAVPVG